MTSRSKRKLDEAENIIEDFLLKNDNNVQKAWDNYMSYYLRKREGFPENIRGIKDFKRVSKKIEDLMFAKELY